MREIVLTGGSGFIGRHLLAVAAREGLAVRPVSREDLEGPGLPLRLRGADAVIHLAGRVRGRQSEPADPDEAYRLANVETTRKVAEACVAAGVPRLVFLSSAGVLGDSSPPGGLADNAPPAPREPYTRSKLAAEELLRRSFRDRIETVILRPPLVYGPGARGNFAALARLAETPFPLPLAGLTAPRSVIGVRNLSDLVLRVATKPGTGGLCMLAADEETTSVADMMRRMRRAAGRSPRLFPIPTSVFRWTATAMGRGALASSLTRPFVLTPTRVHQALGWTPPYSLEEEVRWSVTSTPPGDTGA